MNDDTIIRQRIAGRAVRDIAKSQRVDVRAVNEAIDRFADSVITDKTRKHSLALELARLDELQEVFYQRALEGDVQCGALVTKIIERRCVMLGLSTPQTAVLQIVEEAAPKVTTTDRIEAALNALAASKKNDDPTTH
jgi:hypothetical protein